MVVNYLGTADTAVNGILTQLVSINFNIVDGFALGAAALVGQSLGEKNHVRAYAYGKLSIILSAAIGLVTAFVMVQFRLPLCKCFSKDEAIYTQAADLCKIICFVLIPQAYQWTTTGVLKGAGDTKFTATTAIICIAIIRPFFSYLFCWPLGIGVLGSWIGMLIDQIVKWTMSTIRYSKLTWLEKKA